MPGFFTWVGILALVVGGILGIKKRDVRLFWLIVPILFSEAFFLSCLALGKLVRVQNDIATWSLLAFLLVQFAIISYLIFRLQGIRIAAVSLAVFSASYAFYAAFYAGMAITDRWL